MDRMLLAMGCAGACIAFCRIYVIWELCVWCVIIFIDIDIYIGIYEVRSCLYLYVLFDDDDYF